MVENAKDGSVRLFVGTASGSGGLIRIPDEHGAGFGVAGDGKAMRTLCFVVHAPGHTPKSDVRELAVEVFDPQGALIDRFEIGFMPGVAPDHFARVESVTRHWPFGRYRVVLTRNGAEIQSQEFDVYRHG